MFKKLIIVIWFCLLTGCAAFHTVPLTDHDRHLIKTVYVDPNMKIPEATIINGNQQKDFVFLGVVGSAIGAADDQKLLKVMKEESDNHRANIEKIVYAQWIKQLKEKPTFTLSNESSDTRLVTEIRLYGIALPHAFSSTFRPILNMKAKLIYKGTVIWEDYDFNIVLNSDLPGYTGSEILNDPHKLYIMWNQAAKKIVSDLIKDLDKQ